MEKINLVIACWGGKRFYDKWNPIEYLNMQVATITKFKNKLSQVTFVMNDDSSVPQSYKDYFNTLPYEKLIRPNVGISYGAWVHAYNTYKDKFDYYIVIEDDYCFVKDNFDSIMLDLFTHFKKYKGDCGYLCQLKLRHAINNGIEYWHAGISNGMISSEAFKKATVKYGENFPWSIDKVEQVDFSVGIINGGSTLCDMQDYFSAPFKHRDGAMQTFCSGNKEPLLVPFDLVSNYLKI